VNIIKKSILEMIGAIFRQNSSLHEKVLSTCLKGNQALLMRRNYHPDRAPTSFIQSSEDLEVEDGKDKKKTTKTTNIPNRLMEAELPQGNILSHPRI
jgi:hypothetical protein